jgi:GxxExxY protein
MHELLYKHETYKIIGACMTVHQELGSGFLEAVYQEALAFEFQEQGIPYRKESKIEIYYKERTLQQYYIADFICYDKVIVELKAVQELDTAHVSQVLNYLNATDQQLALLVNFGQSSLQYKRLKV